MKTASLFFVLGITLSGVAQSPAPLPGNPGNIFVSGQHVTLQLAGSSGAHWRALGYNGMVAAQGIIGQGRTDLGPLPVGFYTVSVDGVAKQTTAAVLEPLAAPTPTDSPIGIGSGAAIYHTLNEWNAVASLEKLAGVNWDRQFIMWQAFQPNAGQSLQSNQFDVQVNTTHQAGIHALRIIQGIPAWTENEHARFPSDLRHVYNFCFALAKRWQGVVDAFETSNESDIDNTGAELASYQKAAYLGLKAGNPNVLVATNAWTDAKIASEQADYQANDPASYFDDLNFHHYSPMDSLPNLYSQWRTIAAGKPIWATEFNLNPAPVVNPDTGDPTPDQMKTQAETLVELYATSLYLGSQRSFYYQLTNYIEDGKQYALLHRDMTPRPAYVALAAVGRILAGAKPIGRINGRPNQFAYAFRAVPGGRASDVLVVWASSGSGFLRLPVTPQAMYDTIGRKFPPGQTSANVQFGTSPQFIVLPAGTVSASSALRAGLTPPPPGLAVTAHQPSPVVLQAIFPNEQMVRGTRHFGNTYLPLSMEHLRAQTQQNIQLIAYNFSNHPIAATFSVQAPNGWRSSIQSGPVTLPPMGRVPIALQVSPAMGSIGTPGAVTIHASGSGVGTAVLEFTALP